ncbi:Uncharacterised protein [uncultured archaeon]|nr:Uncharacterised protein [uncultured archaeon]
MVARNKLLGNYGWVQNTSNLRTIIRTLILVPDHGIRHLELRDKIKQQRIEAHDLPRRWEWDARCRIKAIHALGLVKLNRYIQGYELTGIGQKLKEYEASGLRGENVALTEEEKIILKDGLLTNPPVIRVLSLLNEAVGKPGLSKYDIGQRLGFVGDVGFTHKDPSIIAQLGRSFNNQEGDADKWARTILSWLVQIGWAIDAGERDFSGQKIKLYAATGEVATVLRYKAVRITRNVPAEMLCSNHHAFPKLIQKRRSLILQELGQDVCTIQKLIERLRAENINANEEICKFDILNLQNAGFSITYDGGYYKLTDRIELDSPAQVVVENDSLNTIESLIQTSVVKFDMVPPRLVDHLIRFGYDGEMGTEFEGIVAEYFRFLGFDTEYLGQGRGRVTDILAKYIDQTYARSYGLIIDAKATSGRYGFPASDKRKMKEYISLHGPQLMVERIPHHAFSFVSSKFVDDISPHLDEIERDTAIKGCAISVEALLVLGNKIGQGQIRITELYNKFASQGLFSVS